ncbi:MAG: hypothetical protein WC642_08435 [Nocardioides sp.]
MEKLYVTLLHTGETPWQYSQSPSDLDMGTELVGAPVEKIVEAVNSCLRDIGDGDSVQEYWDRRDAGRGVWCVVAP